MSPLTTAMVFCQSLARKEIVKPETGLNRHRVSVSKNISNLPELTRIIIKFDCLVSKDLFLFSHFSMLFVEKT